MVILVTVSAGFIGFHLCTKLLKKGIKVIGIDNLNNYYDVNLKQARNNKLKELSKAYNVDYKFFKGNLEDKDLLIQFLININLIRL